MWSSLEKFAYPGWFYPLIDEKPFITFGLPRDMFIPMAGVAEFTMAFGLLWTPLIRRLSALALLLIFSAAILPFGRVDLIGHALIMGIVVLVAADPGRVGFAAPALLSRLTAIPVGLAVAFSVFALSYWGLQSVLHGPGLLVLQPAAEKGEPDVGKPIGASLPAQLEHLTEKVTPVQASLTP